MFTARKTTGIEQQDAQQAQQHDANSLNVEMTRTRDMSMEAGTLPELYENPDVRCITPNRDAVVVVTGNSVKLFK